MRYKATGNGGQAGGARLRELQLAGGAERAQQRGVASEEDEQARGHALHQRARKRHCRHARRRAEFVQVLRSVTIHSPQVMILHLLFKHGYAAMCT